MGNGGGGTAADAAGVLDVASCGDVRAKKNEKEYAVLPKVLKEKLHQTSVTPDGSSFCQALLSFGMTNCTAGLRGNPGAAGARGGSC